MTSLGGDALKWLSIRRGGAFVVLERISSTFLLKKVWKLSAIKSVFTGSFLSTSNVLIDDQRSRGLFFCKSILVDQYCCALPKYFFRIGCWSLIQVLRSLWWMFYENTTLASGFSSKLAIVFKRQTSLLSVVNSFGLWSKRGQEVFQVLHCTLRKWWSHQSDLLYWLDRKVRTPWWRSESLQNWNHATGSEPPFSYIDGGDSRSQSHDIR